MARPRTDGTLNTGITSASRRSVVEKKEEAKQERKEEKARIAPSAEIILDMIEEEIGTASDINNLSLSPDSTEETYKAAVQARKLNIQFLKDFKIRVENKMRGVK